MNDLVTVYRALDPADAQLICSRLQAEGLTAFVHNEIASLVMEGYSQVTGGILVRVPSDQVETARELIGAKSDDDDASA
jgi:hypothetical protein